MLLSMKPKTICAGCIARDGSTHEHMAYGVINLTIGGITAEVYTEPLARHLADFRIWHEPEVGRLGGACLLRPGVSDVDLFRYCQGVIYFDAQISDGAFDLGVPEQKLDRPEISRAPIDQGRLGASQ
jgi:hypothetical protein